MYNWDGTTVSTSSIDVETIYLSEDADKFDYLVVTASANDTKRHNSVVIDCYSIDWSNFAQYYIDFGKPSNTDDYYLVAFYVNRDNNKKKCQFLADSVGSNYTSIHIQSVIGIKKNSLSTADIAEMAMPSDVYTTLTADSSNNVIAPANGYLQVIYDIVTNNITSVGLDDYVVLIPAGFNGATDCGTELYAVSEGKATKLNIASVLSGHYTVKFIYSIGSAKALGLL